MVFPQAHVVCQAGAQPPLAVETQPRVTKPLVGTQFAVQALRLGQFGHLLGGRETLQPLRQPALGDDFFNWQSAFGCFSAQAVLQRFQQPDLSFNLLFLPKLDRRFDLLRVERHPLTAYLHQR